MISRDTKIIRSWGYFVYWNFRIRGQDLPYKWHNLLPPPKSSRIKCKYPPEGICSLMTTWISKNDEKILKSMKNNKCCYKWWHFTFRVMHFRFSYRILNIFSFKWDGNSFHILNFSYNGIFLIRGSTVYIKCYFNRSIDLAVKVFAKGSGHRGSIPSRVIPKTQKMVLDASWLYTQSYKVWLTLDPGRQLYIFTLLY